VARAIKRRDVEESLLTASPRTPQIRYNLRDGHPYNARAAGAGPEEELQTMRSLIQSLAYDNKSASMYIMEEPLVTTSTDILSGAPVFSGTRVPVHHLTDYLSAGETIETFLEDFPTVSRDQVLRVLTSAENIIVASANENTD
jgi:uncharacterized protein (DUF433 family)